MSELSRHPRRLSRAELVASARDGHVPADRSASDDQLVAAVIRGTKPTALISVWIDGASRREPPAVTRAQSAGLMVWRNTEGIVADGVIFTYAIAREAEAMAALLRAFTMPWSVVERQVRLGRALGYTWADVHAFVLASYGEYPHWWGRTWHAIAGWVSAWGWKRHTGVSVHGWVPMRDPAATLLHAV